MVYVPKEKVMKRRTQAELILKADPQDLAPSVLRNNPGKKKHSGEGFLPPYQGYDGLLVKSALIRSKHFERDKGKYRIKGTPDVVRLVQHLKDYDQEHLVVITVDDHGEQRKVMAINESMIGTRYAVDAQLDQILRICYLSGADGFYVVHNHPVGSADPSKSDISLTALVLMAATCAGFAFCDHVIISSQGSFSFLKRFGGSGGKLTKKTLTALNKALPASMRPKIFPEST